MSARLVWFSVWATGCFQTVHRPACEEVDRRAIADDEATPAGTAAELRQAVALDGVLPGVWWDKSPAEVDVFVASDGEAQWVETTSVDDVSRSFGFGSLHLDIAVFCFNYVEVPLAADVSTLDGGLAVSTAGVATMSDGDIGLGPVNVSLNGEFPEAVFPTTDDDPADWTNKGTFVTMNFGPDGFVDGTAGWQGERRTAETHSGHAEYVVSFFPGDPAPEESPSR